MHIPDALEPRLSVRVNDAPNEVPNFAADALAGLSSEPKRLPSLYFYDERGSELFEKICDLPEYYPTRTEHAILRTHAREIVEYSQNSMSLVELGSGSSTKTRVLIEALIDQQGHLQYHPIDISDSILIESSIRLLQDYPSMHIVAHVAEYNAGIDRISETDFHQKMVVFLGSNIGNFPQSRAVSFLSRIHSSMGPQDCLLLGTDMQKDRGVLEAAYNDAQGVTADFNLNMLRRINGELDGEFDLTAFSHRAFYNEEKSQVEMHLESRKSHDVWVGSLERSFQFRRGESIHTEVSHKYTGEQIEQLAADSGFHVESHWDDERAYFRLSLLTPA